MPSIKRMEQMTSTQPGRVCPEWISTATCIPTYLVICSPCQNAVFTTFTVFKPVLFSLYPHNPFLNFQTTLPQIPFIKTPSQTLPPPTNSSSFLLPSPQNSLPQSRNIILKPNLALLPSSNPNPRGQEKEGRKGNAKRGGTGKWILI